MSTATLNGITVDYTDAGAGPPVLLVHGHPFDRSMWRPQLAHLPAAGYRAIAPDLRGYGGSSVVPGITPLSTFAGDLAALLDHLDVPAATLVGLSMGGQIVLEFHRRFPRRVRGLVLADTSATAETEAGRRNRTEMAKRLLREGLERYAHEVLPKMISPRHVETMPDLARHVLDMMRGTDPAGAAAALHGRAERTDYVSALPGVAVPTLVVVGADDEFTPLADAELIHRHVPGARLAVLDDAAHLPNLERPAEFNRVLTGFLATVPR
ncbi:Pimeloyl-ACP methyl ester carboxylesterase [Amycolatopsis arida]|uniref:Pimeloyl-ACP methyl ester carboxylesterase n=1 Tax=Amycolatopsis arida TaxID=587909 RepID=A0A1I5YEL5_9PSEU|nr:alpha/beta fold hydrolase [Amycolatopsis arida]TDX90459.1 pimeloyl-ACP methyl ester carboxylesterase [Amycolatopsis arida]SFQ42649.1 Pimeloyl-ACP methyl ester carboxylesterase [Amycolatopsis arida]